MPFAIPSDWRSKATLPVKALFFGYPLHTAGEEETSMQRMVVSSPRKKSRLPTAIGPPNRVPHLTAPGLRL